MAERQIANSISTLPDELLLLIISLLPFKEAVRTAVLSSRWRYLYASMSNLDFNFIEGEIANPISFMNIVDRLFYSRSRSRCSLDKFRLSWEVSDLLTPLHIQGWLQAVAWHGIHNLDLVIPDSLHLPSSLCTCKTLEVLKLEMIPNYGPERHLETDGPNWEIPAKVCLPNLKVLHLLQLTFANDASLNRLISNAPVLEDLICNFWDYDCKLCFKSYTQQFGHTKFMP